MVRVGTPHPYVCDAYDTNTTMEDASNSRISYITHVFYLTYIRKIHPICIRKDDV